MPSTVHDPVYRGLIDRLIAARTDVLMTQAAVAKKLGRPQSYVAKIESYERRIDVIEFLALAKAMGIDPLPLLRKAWKSVRDARD